MLLNSRTRWPRSRKRRHNKLTARYRPMLEPLESRILLTASVAWSTATWAELGPGPLLGSTADVGLGLQNSPVSGAVNVIAVQPTPMSNIAIVGTVNGGIWRTDNFQASPYNGVDDDMVNGIDDPGESPQWVPLTDQFPSLSIGDLAFSPLDANTVFAGTGAMSSDLRLGGQGGLIYRSTNAGTTWSVYSALGTGPEATRPITTILPTGLSTDPMHPADTQVILAGTAGDDGNGKWSGGLFRSTDGGRTWALVTWPQIEMGAISSIVADPGNPMIYYAAIGGDPGPGTNAGVYRSTDGGLIWDRVNGTNPEDLINLDLAERIRLSAVSIGGATVVWAGVVVHAGPDKALLDAVYQTTDGGGHWHSVGIAPAIHPGLQGGYHFAILGDPHVATRVYVAGDQTGMIYAGDAATNTWTQISGVFTGNSSPHADSRSLAMDREGNLVLATDGGVFRLRTSASEAITGVNQAARSFTINGDWDGWISPGAMFTVTGSTSIPSNNGTYTVEAVNTTTHTTTLVVIASQPIASPAVSGNITLQRWESVVGNLATIEVHHSIAWDPLNEAPLAGLQDNGAAQFVGGAWWEAAGGDGNTVAAVVNPDGTVTRYLMTNYFGDFPYSIAGVNATANTFLVKGNLTSSVAALSTIRIVNSAGNNGDYTIAASGVTYSSATNLTSIVVTQPIPSTVVNGGILLRFGNPLTISAANPATHTFTLSRDVPHVAPGSQIHIANSGADDGDYTVVSTSGTTLRVSQVIPSSVVAPMSQMLFGAITQFWRRTFDSSGATVSDWENIPLAIPALYPVQPGSGLSLTAQRFKGFTRVPYAVNAANSSRLLIAADLLYESSDRGDTIKAIPVPGVNDDGSYYSAVAYGWRPTGSGAAIEGVFYAAKGSVVVAGRQQPNGTWNTVIYSLAGALVEDLVIDPTNADHAYLVDSESTLWLTLDGGHSWSKARGDLPFVNPKVASVAAMVVSGRTVLLVGGANGVFRALPHSLADVAAGTETLHWIELGENLPNAIVTDIVYQPNISGHGDTLVVGTLGRGLWKIDHASAAVLMGQILDITGDGAADTVTLRRSSSNPLIVEVLADDILQRSVPASTIQSITFNGGGGNDRLIIDTTNGLITPPLGIDYDGGPGTGNTLEFTGPYRRIGSNDSRTVRVISGAEGDMLIYTTNVASATQSASHDTGLSTALAGLLRLSDWTSRLNDGHEGAVPIPGFGNGVAGALAGQPLPMDQPGDQVGQGPGPEVEAGNLGGDLHSLLGAFFDAGGIDLAALAASMASLEDLRAALDRLDTTDGNVSLSQVGDTTTFNLIAQRTLEGDATLFADILGGAVQLDGAAHMTADVRLHLVFGFDNNGFFIDPGAAVNADGDPEPEIVISNFHVDANGSGGGRLGFLQVDMSDASLTVDPLVKLKIDFIDPGADPVTGINDGLIRLHELPADPTSMAHATLEGNPSGDDVTLEADFAARAVFPGGGAPLDLADARVRIAWADVNDTTTATISAGAGAGSGATDLIEMIQTTAAQFLSGMQAVSNWVNQLASQDVLGTNIPLINRSLGEIMDEFPAPLVLDNSTGETVYDLSDTYTEGSFKKFVVSLAGVRLSTEGVSIGDVVTYTDTGAHVVTGEVDAVVDDKLIIRFSSSLDQNPDRTVPSFSIARRGSLQKRLQAVLGKLSDITSMSAQAPTLQQLVRELAHQLGVDPSQIPIAYDATNRTIEVTPVFHLQPLTFTQRLDFGDSIPGLSIDATGDLSITIDPSFQFTLGMKIDSTSSWEDRFYIKENADPEVTLTVTAQLDDPVLTGALGFLDVRLTEDGAVTPNEGLMISAVVTVHIVDPISPGVGVGDDYITVGDLTVAHLPQLFQMGITGSVDIDGLVLSADVGTSTVGTVSISLDGATDGHIGSLADLAALPSVLYSRLSLQTNFDDFLSFDHITPQMVLDALQGLIDRIRDLGGAGSFVDKPLPLINKSLSDIVDVGQKLADDLDSLSTTDGATVATAKLLADYLNAHLSSGTVTVVANPGDIRFNLNYTDSISKVFPIVFNLGDAGAFLNVDGTGTLTITGGLSVALSLGFNTGEGLSLDQRIFLGTDGANQISITGSANVGYDVNGDGIPDAAPFDVELSGFGRHFGVVDARALIDLHFDADLVDGGDGDGKLTFAEIGANIISAPENVFTANFMGTAQAIVPLDGDGDGVVASDPSLLAAGDAIVEVGGALADLITGGIDLRLDPTAGDDLPHHTNRATPLTPSEMPAGHFVIVGHNLTGFVVNGLLSFDSLLDGLEQLISWGQGLLGIDILDFKLPIIGVSVHDGLDFLESTDPGSLRYLINQLESDPAALAASATNAAVYVAADRLRDILGGVPGLVAIGDLDGDGTVETNGDDLISIQRGDATSAYTVTAPTFTDITGSQFKVNKTGAMFPMDGVAPGDVMTYTSGGVFRTGTVLTVEDTAFVVAMDTGSASPDIGTDVNLEIHPDIDGVTFMFQYAPGFSHTYTFDLGGLGGIGLRGDFVATFTGNLTLNLGFGINKTDGFFVKTDFSDVPMRTIDANAPEISLSGNISATGSANIHLGFIEFNASLPVDSSGSAMTFLTAGLNINLDGLGDGKLTMSELLDFGNLGDIIRLDAPDPGISLDVQAQVDIHLLGAIDADLPQISADFVLQWDNPAAAGTPFDVFTDGVPTPDIALLNIQLDAGSFLDKVAGQVFREINRYNVIAPVADVLNTEIPIIGETLFELLIEPLPADQQAAAEFIFNLTNKISETASLAATAADAGWTIPLGDVAILGTVTLASYLTPAAGPYPGDSLPFIGSFISELGDIGITFPMLDVANLAKFLTGQDIDLVFVQLPHLAPEVNFNVSFPLFSFGIPLIADVYVEAFVGGSMGLYVDLTGGLDTRGLRNGGSFMDGFYLGDFDPGDNGIIDPSDRERNEFGLTASIYAGIDAGVRVLAFPVGQITGQGTISADIGVDLNDDNEDSDGNPLDSRSATDRHDGKFHLDEMETELGIYGGNPLCLFDLKGELTVRLDLKIEVNLLFIDWDWSWGKEWTLLTFDEHCTPTPPDLANLVTSGGEVHLVLTSTDSTHPAQWDIHAGSNDPEGDLVTVTPIDANAVPEDGLHILDLAAGAVTVSTGSGTLSLDATNPGAQWRVRGLAEGQRVGYFSSGILVYATVSSASDTSMTLHMDDTANTPDAGTAFIVYSGKETIRVMRGHVTEDFGPGEDWPNYIADISTIALITDQGGGPLNGFGAGDDTVTIDKLLRVKVRLDGGDGADTLTAGSGGATLYGGDGNDVLSLAAAPGDLTGAETLFWASHMYGGNGDDYITGGPGNDILLGGEGNDTIDGGAGTSRAGGLSDPLAADYSGGGDDFIVGGGGNDILEGRGGNDTLVGDYDATADPQPALQADRHEGTDTINGAEGDDHIWGDNRGFFDDEDGSQAAESNNPDDLISGGAGRDLVFGGAGNDVIYGNEGNDILHGGSGHDEIDGNAGDDFILGEEGNDALLGEDGNDTILGGWHDDVIRSGTGDDYIEGGPGNDAICADEGDDTIWGGTAVFGLPWLGPAPAIEVLPGGWTQFSCDSPLTFTDVPLDLTLESAIIQGQKFFDRNGDGIRDAGEEGLNGWTIKLYDAAGTLVGTTITADVDLNEDGSIDPLAETGIYRFSDLSPGSYSAVESVVEGWVQTYPGGAASALYGTVVQPLTLAHGDFIRSIDFGNTLPGNFSGVKYADLDGNGKRGAQEPGLLGVTVYLDFNDNGMLDAGEPSTVTAADGSYHFDGLNPGTYLVREVPPAGSEQTEPLAADFYASNFDLGAGPEWSLHDISYSLLDDPYLGQFGNGIVQLNLTDLPTHSQVQVSFDLLVIGSWDGIEGDYFRFGVAGAPSPLLDTTFSNIVEKLQNYPAMAGLGVNPAQATAISINQVTGVQDATYHITLTFDHTADSLNLQFQAAGTTGGIPGADATAEAHYYFGDFDGDRDVDFSDLFKFRSAFLTHTGDPNYLPAADYDGDGDVDFLDLFNFRKNFLTLLPPPQSPIVPLAELPPSAPILPNGAGGQMLVPPHAKSISLDLSGATQKVVVDFDQDVSRSLTLDDLVIINVDTGKIIDPAGFQLQYDSLLHRATWTLDGLPGKRLPQGNYQVRVRGDGVANAGGLHLAGNEDPTDETWGLDNVQVRLLGVSLPVTVVSGNTSPGNNLGNQAHAGAVDGHVFQDLNGNGRQDPGEPGMAQVIVYGDLNGNGTLDANEPAVFSLGTIGPLGYPTGEYHLGNLPDGTYPIRQIVLQGMIQTVPVNAFLFTLSTETTYSNADFGDAFLNQGAPVTDSPVNPQALADAITITGHAFDDADANGLWNLAQGEPGLNGWVVGITITPAGGSPYSVHLITADMDLNNDGVITDDEHGTYRLEDVPLGAQVVITETVPSGWTLSVPQNNSYIFTAMLPDPVDLNFGNHQTVTTIGGVKWNDADGDGKRGPSEGGIGGVTIYLDLNDNGEYDAGEPTALTQFDNPSTPEDETGRYQFTVVPGSYVIREVVPTGYTQTLPAGGGGYHIQVGGQPLGNLDFGNQGRRDVPDGDDLIYGEEGIDTIHGDNDPAMPDVASSGTRRDTIYGGEGDDTIDGQERADIIWGGQGNDIISGGQGADDLHGEDGDDNLSGGDGPDTLSGGEGNDGLSGNAGNDTYVFGDTAVASTDILNEAPGAGEDTLSFIASTSAVVMDLTVQSANRVTNLTIDLEDGTGGNGAANFEDILGSLTAVNTLTGNNANNVLIGGLLADVIAGGSGDDALYGNDGADQLQGGSDNDLLDGGRGDDALIGGTDDDTYLLFDDWGVDQLLESAGGGTDTLDASGVSGPILVNIFGSSVQLVSGSNTLNHGGLNLESIITGAADDVIAFGTGNPAFPGTIDTGAGVDMLDYSQYTILVQVDLGAGTATGIVGSVYHVENVIGSPTARNELRGDPGPNHLVGGAAADDLRGRGGSDYLEGQGDTDVLSGGAGNDVLIGGEGDDHYIFEDGFGTDSVSESVGGGLDTLDFSGVTRPLFAILGSILVVDDMGNAVVYDGTDIEQVIGGAANDTLVGLSTGNTWQINGADIGSVNGIGFASIENLLGPNGDDTFAFAPGGSISGNIDGGGGAGINTLNYTGFGASVTVDLTAGTATGAGHVARIQNVLGSALFANNLTGDGANNVLVGGTAADLLFGMGGDDTFVGSGGSDVVTGGPGADTLLGPDAANTWQISGVNTGLLGSLGFSEVENLEGGALADSFVFAAGASVTGTLHGGSGSDTLDYSAYVTPITINLQTQTATGTGGISGIDNMIAGSTATDQLIGPNVATMWNLTSATGGDITSGPSFQNFELLTGGDNADTFNLMPFVALSGALSLGAGDDTVVFGDQASIAGTIDGGIGTDTLDYTAYTTPVIVDFSANTATGTGGISQIEAAINATVVPALTPGVMPLASQSTSSEALVRRPFSRACGRLIRIVAPRSDMNRTFTLTRNVGNSWIRLLKLKRLSLRAGWAIVVEMLGSDSASWR